MKQEIKDKLVEKKAALEKMQNEMNREIHALFHDGFKEVFQENTELDSVEWTQFTPYWNDGDECVFRSDHKHAEIMIAGALWTHDCNIQTKNDVKGFLDVFDSDDMESMFGDHAKVTVTKNGIEVEEYEHE